MRKLTQGLAFGLMVVLAGVGLDAGPANALPPLEKMLEEKVIGDPNAPVTIIEYASLGCPHCRSFHADTLPQIKKNYIDTGKAKLVYRDFPLGQRALAASMIARCAGPVRYFAMLEILFRDQPQWTQAQDAFASLQASAKKGGMSGAQVDQCLRFEPLLLGIRQQAQHAQDTYGIRSTPSFLVETKGETQKIEGAISYGEFSQILNRVTN